MSVVRFVNGSVINCLDIACDATRSTVKKVLNNNYGGNMKMNDIEVFGYYKEWSNGEIENIDITHEQVSFIKYHQPQGDGDRHYVSVVYTDGTCHRVFNPDTVRFK